MVRPVIYISLLISIIISGYTIQQNTRLKQDYYAVMGYEEINKSQLLYNFQDGMVFVIKSSYLSDPIVYRVEHLIKDYTYSIASLSLENMLYRESNIITLIHTNKLVFDPPMPMDYRDLKKQINDSNSFHAFSPITANHSLGSFASFDVLESFSGRNLWKLFIIALSLLGIELFIKYLQKLHWIKKPYLIHCIAILCFMTYTSLLPYILLGNAPVFFSASIYFVASGYTILCYPIFQFAKSRLGSFDFIDKEALKFIILFALLSAGMALFNWPIITTVFKSQLGLNIDRSVIDLTFYQNAFLFSTGNLIVNTFFYFYPKNSYSHRIKIAEEKALKSEAALSSIQSSVNPHFLYNALNSIATLTKTDAVKTEKMTLALSSFYKYVTNRKGNLYSTISKEIEMIETYLEIEKIRFEDRLRFELDIQANLESVEIPNFLLQPLVENAIKYGYDKSTDTIDIKIMISRTKKAIEINIYDQGAQFDETLNKGYGLRSVTKKLQLLYPDRHEISFINNPKRVSIILKQITND